MKRMLFGLLVIAFVPGGVASASFIGVAPGQAKPLKVCIAKSMAASLVFFHGDAVLFSQRIDSLFHILVDSIPVSYHE